LDFQQSISNDEWLFQTTDDGGRNILLHSVISLSMNAVELLLDYPMADINTIDADGQTCFHHLAMLTGNSDLTTANEATELLQHILDGEMDPHLNAQDNYGYTPLHIAVSHGSIEAVALLLSCGGVDINQTDHGGSTPLDHYTAANTDTLSSVVAEGSNEMAFHNLLDVPTSDKVEQVNDMMEILQNHNPPALSLNPPSSNIAELYYQVDDHFIGWEGHATQETDVDGLQNSPFGEDYTDSEQMPGGWASLWDDRSHNQISSLLENLIVNDPAIVKKKSQNRLLQMALQSKPESSPNSAHFSPGMSPLMTQEPAYRQTGSTPTCGVADSTATLHGVSPLSTQRDDDEVDPYLVGRKELTAENQEDGGGGADGIENVSTEEVWDAAEDEWLHTTAIPSAYEVQESRREAITEASAVSAGVDETWTEEGATSAHVEERDQHKDAPWLTSSPPLATPPKRNVVVEDDGYEEQSYASQETWLAPPSTHATPLSRCDGEGEEEWAADVHRSQVVVADPSPRLPVLTFSM
jgi:hypothetical protein